jgi:hypothetical protein
MPKVTPLPPAPNPQSDSSEQFSLKAAAFVAAQVAMVTEFNAAIEDVNSLAAGGAYAIPYVHRASSSNVGSSAGGMLAIRASSIQLDTKSSAGANVAALLASFDDSTSAVTGTLRLQKVGDTSKWAVYTVTSYVPGETGLYVDIYGSLVGSSSGGNPFADNDLVLLSFQRTGDKGQTGGKGDPGLNAALALLGSATVSAAVASINFLNVFTSACDTYRIEIEAAMASASDTLVFQLAVAGAVDTSTKYSAVAGASTDTGYVTLSGPSTGAVSHTLTIRNANSTLPKVIGVDGAAVSGTSVSALSGSAAYIGASAVTGFRLSWFSGANFAGGIVRVYGISNT